MSVFKSPIYSIPKGGRMVKKIKTLPCKYFIKQRYVLGIDYSNGEDFGCKAEGHIGKNGKIYITKVKWF